MIPHPTVGLVTDSNSQLPESFAAEHGIEVVPLTVTVDGQGYAEGTELSADDFYARFADGAAPEVSTAAPPPGAFIAAYERLAARGVTEILSIHIGADVSSTINSARVAADSVDVPVTLVDTGTASFGVACCVWEAARALASGGSAADAKWVAETLAPSVGNVFVVGALDLARAGGRLEASTNDGEDSDDEHSVAVLSLVKGQIQRVGVATDLLSAADVMAHYITDGRTDLRVAVGVADTGAEGLWHALEDRVAGSPAVAEVVRYRIGPSVAAHTGPGTAGAFFWPVSS